MAHDVFISYSSLNKATADEVCEGLEAEGIRCWIAPRDIPPASNYGAEIDAAIEGSAVLVLIFSSSANTSRYVMREVEAALHYGKAILPFRLEEVDISRELRFYLRAYQWLDATRPPDPLNLDDLSKGVWRYLSPQDVAAATERKQSSMPAPEEKPALSSPQPEEELDNSFSQEPMEQETAPAEQKREAEPETHQDFIEPVKLGFNWQGAVSIGFVVMLVLIYFIPRDKPKKETAPEPSPVMQLDENVTRQSGSLPVIPTNGNPPIDPLPSDQGTSRGLGEVQPSENSLFNQHKTGSQAAKLLRELTPGELDNAQEAAQADAAQTASERDAIRDAAQKRAAQLQAEVDARRDQEQKEAAQRAAEAEARRDAAQKRQQP